MFSFILFLTLIFNAYCADKFLVISSTDSVSVVSPPNYVVAVQPNYLVTLPNIIGNNAQSVWVNSTGITPNLKVVFQSVFYSACTQSMATMVIRADDSFTVLLNGRPVGSGAGWQKTFTFKLSLQCGINNLQITVVNGEGPGCLTFFITQNQDSCYQCAYNAFYKIDECQCQCSNNVNSYVCQNSLQKIANKYPYCGCFCNNKAFTICRENQYFDDSDCECKCLPILCSSKLQQDPSSCMCRCKAQTCPSDQIWSYSRCTCIKKKCVIGATCVSQNTYNQNCSPSTVKCSGNSKFDDKTCSCVRLQL